MKVLDKTKLKLEKFFSYRQLKFCFWGNNVVELVGMNFDVIEYESSIIPISCYQDELVDIVCVVGPINSIQVDELVHFLGKRVDKPMTVLLHREIDSLVLGDRWYHLLREKVTFDLEFKQNRFSLTELMNSIYQKRYDFAK